MEGWLETAAINPVEFDFFMVPSARGLSQWVFSPPFAGSNPVGTKAYVPNGSTPYENLELYKCGISPMRCQDINGIGNEAPDLRF